MKSWKTFERRVARMIVDKFKSKGITEDDCYRTPMSGAHRISSKANPGDLVISSRLEKLFPVHVECKAVKSVDFTKLYEPSRTWKKSWWIRQWMEQVERDSAKKPSLIPLLVFKTDYSMPLCAHRREDGGTALRRFQFEWHGKVWYVIPFASFLKQF